VEDERGYHGPGVNAALGAAFGAGRVLGLTKDEMTNATGIAASHGGGLLEFHREGAMTKRLHIGRGAQMGLESALLASRGFTGPSTALEGGHGFLSVYSPSPRPDLLVADLGRRWLLHEVTLKAYACHLSFQAAVDAVQRFRLSQTFAADDVRAVRIESAERMMQERFLARRPTTLLGAQYSLPWSVALALTRDVSAPTAWTEDDLADPALRRIAAMIELVTPPDSRSQPETRILLDVGGREHSLSATDWKGATTNRCTFDDAAEKLSRYAAPYLSRQTVEAIVETTQTLEKISDVAGLAHCIRLDEAASTG
jgi:2-methylcitrate dehydratase PrpD